MLKRGTGSKASYSPYSTGQRIKKADSKTKLDLLPNKANVWLKQVGDIPSGFLYQHRAFTIIIFIKTFNNLCTVVSLFFTFLSWTVNYMFS